MISGVSESGDQSFCRNLRIAKVVVAQVMETCKLEGESRRLGYGEAWLPHMDGAKIPR